MLIRPSGSRVSIAGEVAPGHQRLPRARELPPGPLKSHEARTLHFTPKDQIILLAGLEADQAHRAKIWSLPELRSRLERLTEAGLVQADELTTPDGVEAAGRLHHIRLDDLLAEHLPGQTS
jgi:hypothetical protein